MPWWGWVLVALGILTLIGVAWVVLFIHLVSQGDLTD